MIFLASLPRSGSTLLTCLLNQRPDVYASPTSNLCDTMGAAVQAWEQNPTTQASGGTKKDLVRILKGIAKSRYATKQTVFDKGRGWSAPQIIETMKKVQGGVKIVTTVRPIADCLSSFVKLTKPDNVRDFCRNSQLAEHLMSSYHTIKAGYEAYPECFLFVEYDDLVKDPQTQLDRIAEFVGLDLYEGDINNVEDSKEEDEVWGINPSAGIRFVESLATNYIRSIRVASFGTTNLNPCEKKTRWTCSLKPHCVETLKRRGRSPPSC
jgi:hypothetical protein